MFPLHPLAALALRVGKVFSGDLRQFPENNDPALRGMPLRSFLLLNVLSIRFVGLNKDILKRLRDPFRLWSYEKGNVYKLQNHCCGQIEEQNKPER